MKNGNIAEEVVHRNETVKFHRSIHEAPTEDGLHLVMTRKVPLHRTPVAPVLLIHGLGQNRYSWTLPHMSFENYLVSQGFETFNAEFRGHGLSRANGCDVPDNFEAYLDCDLPALVDAVLEISGGEKPFYMGHSLGGTIGYAAGPSIQDRLLGMVSIGGPFDMGRGNAVLRGLARLGVRFWGGGPGRFYEPGRIAFDLMAGPTKAGLFVLDNPLNRFPVHVWYPGTIDRQVLVERIEKGFDRTSFSVVWLVANWFAESSFRSTDGKTNYREGIRNLHLPMLFVAGDRDCACPPASIGDAYERVGSSDKSLLVFGDEKPGVHWGHCDLLIGRRAPQVVWPRLSQWMRHRVVSQRVGQPLPFPRVASAEPRGMDAA